MRKREPLLAEEYFDSSLELSYEFVEEAIEDSLLPQDQVRNDLLYFSLFQEFLEIIELKYSRGYSIEELKNDFVASLNALEKYRIHSTDDPENFFFNGEQDEYMQAVELLSLAVLLHVDTEVFQRLVVAIGVDGQDYLLDWLVARRLPARRPATTRLLFPKTYARLRDAIQAPPDLQPRLLRAFLAGWYESLDTVWYNIHAHRQDSAGFTGYWCWEAAAVAYCLGLDDAELQPMPYYPADLADYAFGRKPRLSA